MPAYGAKQETNGGRRPGMLAVTFVILALSTSYLPATAQQRIAWTMRVTVLRPFLATQERLAAARMNARNVDELMGQIDSMTAVLSTQAALLDENRTLRDLLDLAERQAHPLGEQPPISEPLLELGFALRGQVIDLAAAALG